MPVATFTSPFPQLSLALNEREELHATAMTLIDNAQAAYERFLWQDNATIDKHQWAKLREREDIRVYRDRRPDGGTGNNDMNALLLVGTVVGDLGDAMYGVLNHSTNDMRIKTAYVHDTLLDCAVLDTILEPTPEQPYQSMTVRWVVKGVPRHVRAIAKHCDSVYVEATGVRQLSNGERVGYHLMHSVSFDKAPLLAQYNRFNFSVCAMWRQASKGRVQAYLTSYVELEESFLAPFLLKSCADALVSLWKYPQCAQLKKLAWVIQQKGRVTPSGRCVNRRRARCSTCGSNSKSLQSSSKSVCGVCSCLACKKCRIKRSVSIIALDGQLMTVEVRVCVRCITLINTLDAEIVARDETRQPGDRQYDPATWAALCSIVENPQPLYAHESLPFSDRSSFDVSTCASSRSASSASSPILGVERRRFT